MNAVTAFRQELARYVATSGAIGKATFREVRNPVEKVQQYESLLGSFERSATRLTDAVDTAATAGLAGDGPLRFARAAVGLLDDGRASVGARRTELARLGFTPTPHDLQASIARIDLQVTPLLQRASQDLL